MKFMMMIQSALSLINEVYEKVSVPMARPDNLGEFPIEDR
jgi:hypothetical protein